MDEQSLTHTKWKCQYHIVFILKYRRKVVYGKLWKNIGEILRRLCEFKHVKIMEAHAMPDQWVSNQIVQLSVLTSLSSFILSAKTRIRSVSIFGSMKLLLKSSIFLSDMKIVR